MKLQSIIFSLILLLIPTSAWAAQEKLPWWATLLFVTTTSTIISALLVWKNKKFETFTEKAMGFGAWFWFIIFLQIMVYGFYIGFVKYMR